MPCQTRATRALSETRPRSTAQRSRRSPLLSVASSSAGAGATRSSVDAPAPWLPAEVPEQGHRDYLWGDTDSGCAPLRLVPGLLCRPRATVTPPGDDGDEEAAGASSAPARAFVASAIVVKTVPVSLAPVDCTSLSVSILPEVDMSEEDELDRVLSALGGRRGGRLPDARSAPGRVVHTAVAAAASLPYRATTDLAAMALSRRHLGAAPRC